MTNLLGSENRWEIRCETILNLDKKIIFVEIAHLCDIFIKKSQEFDGVLSPKSIEESIDKSLNMWADRKRLTENLEPIFAYTKYEKFTRVTIPIIDDGLILVFINSTDFPETLIQNIIEQVKL